MYKLKSEILLTISWIKIFIQDVYQILRLPNEVEQRI